MQQDSAAAAALSQIPVFRAVDLKASSGGGSWKLENLIGILAEVSEETRCGALSFAAEIVLEAQQRREPVAWVSAPDSIFFPPDLEQRGIDLSALAVIRTGGGGSVRS